MSESDILSIQLWFGAAAIAFMAIAMTAAGWNHRYFIRTMFGVAALMAALALFWRQISGLVPDQTQELLAAVANNKIAWLILFAFGIGAALIIARVRGLGSSAPRKIATRLRLQFAPNSVNPTCLEMSNISNWYALRNSFIAHEAPSKKHPQGRQHETRFWTIFIVFDRPVAHKQIVFDTNGASLPTIEVKDRSARHALIMISGDMPGAILDISAVI